MKYILFAFATFALISCQNEAETSQIIQQTQLSEPVELTNSLENNTDSLQYIYTENAVKIDENGKVFHNRNEIMEYYKTNDFSIHNLEVIKTVLAGQENNFEYEISQFETANDKTMKQVVIWDLTEKPKKRTFEFIAKATSSKDIVEIIDNRRDEWIHLCNQHNASNLIEEMYTKNTVYYNHKPVIVGHKDLAVEYQYMNRDKYELFLEPTIVEMVQDDLVYEIGQCSGTYGGKYILIWQKGKDDVWRILVDSNI